MADGEEDRIHDAGMEVRRAVLGDAHVDRAIERTTDFTAPFQDFITRYAWGSVWTRPGLERRTRSAITLAVLTALGRENEIAMHVRGALRNGMTPGGDRRGAAAHRDLRGRAGGQRRLRDRPADDRRGNDGGRTRGPARLTCYQRLSARLSA